jgi:hypothetical protein
MKERLIARVVELASLYGRLWVSSGVGTVADGRLACEPKKGGAHLAPGGVQGAPEAAQAGAFVAERRFLRKEKVRAAESCMGI